MKISHFLALFVPAIFLVMLVFFIRFIQYSPLEPEVQVSAEEVAGQQKKTSVIPIFPGDPLLGQKTAAQTLILFGDFGCESCKIEYELLKTVLEQYPNKMKVIWKGLPVSTIPFNTEIAQKYGFCANKQNKFEAWADVAFANSFSLSEQTIDSLATEIQLDQNELQTCLQAQETVDHIQKTKDIAELLKVQSVPTLFLNNVQISTPQSLDEWKTILSL